MGTRERIASLAVERYIALLDSLEDARPQEIPMNGALTESPHRTLVQGDVDIDWDLAEISFADSDGMLGTWSPDANAAEEWGEAFGIRYAASEPLRCGDKERERDRHRWELDPASADDYLDRIRPRSR